MRDAQTLGHVISGEVARFDYAFDPNAARAVEALGGDASNFVALIDANGAAIEAAGVVQHSYTAPGEEHRILDIDKFYEMEVNGVRLVDWVDALIGGEPLDDVHYEDCETGSRSGGGTFRAQGERRTERPSVCGGDPTP